MPCKDNTSPSGHVLDAYHVQDKYDKDVAMIQNTTDKKQLEIAYKSLIQQELREVEARLLQQLNDITPTPTATNSLNLLNNNSLDDLFQDGILEDTTRQAAKQLTTNGNINLRTIANGLLRRTGRAIGQSIGESLFNNRDNSPKLGTSQWSSDALEGLFKGRRNQ